VREKRNSKTQQTAARDHDQSTADDALFLQAFPGGDVFSPIENHVEAIFAAMKQDCADLTPDDLIWASGVADDLASSATPQGTLETVSPGAKARVVVAAD
jgi:hypothetical protein